MGDTSGSIKGASLDGVSYRVAADANFGRMASIYENSMVATSGKSMRKMVKQVPQLENAIFIVNSEEVAAIKALSESLDILKLQYTAIDGTVYRANGQINLGPHESEENRLPVTFLPEEDWTPFFP